MFKTNETIRIFGEYSFGVVLALLTIWVITSVFLDGICTFAWDPSVSERIGIEGSDIQWRSEGWATTHYGPYGLIGFAGKELSEKPKVVIWGDSFVEALQVDDRFKMSNRLNTVWNACQPNKLEFLALGQSGRSLADYYFEYPSYSHIIKNVKVHVIVIGNIEDALPGTHEGHSLFLDSPTFSLVAAKPNSFYDNLNPRLLAAWKLQFVWQLGRQVVPITSPSQWRLNIGPVSKPRADSKSGTTLNAQKAFRFILERFKQTWKEPAVFVYLPTVPRIQQGRIVTEDDNQELAELFAEECVRLGYSMVNMKESFLDFFQVEGKFPRGFANTRPGEGHLNVYGHELVADAIKQELEMKYNAVLSEGISAVYLSSPALSSGRQEP